MAPLDTLAALVVGPRFGCESVEDYYRTQSVAGHLTELQLPTLMLFADSDPLVPLRVVQPFLPTGDGRGPIVRRAARGGHLGFPRDLDLGFGPERGLYGQLAGFWSTL